MSTRSTNQLTSEWKRVIHCIVLTAWLRARLSIQMAGIVCSLVHQEPIVSLINAHCRSSKWRSRTCFHACPRFQMRKGHVSVYHACKKSNCNGVESVKVKESQTWNQNNECSLTAVWIWMPLVNLLITSNVFELFFSTFPHCVFLATCLNRLSEAVMQLMWLLDHSILSLSSVLSLPCSPPCLMGKSHTGTTSLASGSERQLSRLPTLTGFLACAGRTRRRSRRPSKVGVRQEVGHVNTCELLIVSS